MNKNIYITVTTGRSGTGYLQKIFDIIPSFTSVHESSIPKPGFWENKINEISILKTENYIETSHLICKGWIEPLINLGVVPRLIILKRKWRDVALSLLSLNAIPHRTKAGIKYLLSPPTKYLKYNDYQLCYWYCLEIERRQEHYSNLILSYDGYVFETSIELIKKEKHFISMLQYFNIEYDDDVITAYNNIKNKKINTKDIAKKKPIYTDKDLDIFEIQIRNEFAKHKNG